jgi:dolichol-phosphate mannosyltransferase
MKLSIVCPAYEEEACLPLFHQELDRVLSGLADGFTIEIVYVDDGSKDRTLQVIRELASKDSRIRYLSLSRNFGHQAALTAGLEHASGDLVITMDADLQHPPAVIPLLLDRWRQGHDVVLTIRQEDRRLSLGKRLTSRTFYKVMGWLSDTDIRPAGSDFRLMTRKAVNGLLQLREQHRFLRGMVQWLGFSTAEVVFQPDIRKAGQSKYTLRRMLRLAGDGLFSFSCLPLRIPLYLGSLTVAFSLLLGLVAAGRAAFGHTVGSWIFLLVTGLFLGGCILWAVGVLGEYVGRIYQQVKDRPLYVLKDQYTDRTGGLAVTQSQTPDPRREAA